MQDPTSSGVALLPGSGTQTSVPQAFQSLLQDAVAANATSSTGNPAAGSSPSRLGPSAWATFPASADAADTSQLPLTESSNPNDPSAPASATAEPSVTPYATPAPNNNNNSTSASLTANGALPAANNMTQAAGVSNWATALPQKTTQPQSPQQTHTSSPSGSSPTGAKSTPAKASKTSAQADAPSSVQTTMLAYAPPQTLPIPLPMALTFTPQTDAGDATASGSAADALPSIVSSAQTQTSTAAPTARASAANVVDPSDADPQTADLLLSGEQDTTETAPATPDDAQPEAQASSYVPPTAANESNPTLNPSAPSQLASQALAAATQTSGDAIHARPADCATAAAPLAKTQTQTSPQTPTQTQAKPPAGTSSKSPSTSTGAPDSTTTQAFVGASPATSLPETTGKLPPPPHNATDASHPKTTTASTPTPQASTSQPSAAATSPTTAAEPASTPSSSPSPAVLTPSHAIAAPTQISAAPAPAALTANVAAAPIPSSNSGSISSSAGAPNNLSQPSAPDVADPQQPLLTHARLTQALNGSQMQVNLSTEEFGRISVHAGYGRDSLTAQITLDNSQLSSAISSHLPAAEQRLAGEHGLRTSITVATSTSGQSLGGGQTGSGSQNNSSQNGPKTNPFTRSFLNGTDDSPASSISATPATSTQASSGRLNITI